MATLEERLRRLTASKQESSKGEEQAEKPTSKPKPVQASQKRQTQPQDTSEETKKKKIDIPKMDAVVQGIKEEADTMEHSMVAKICNDLTRFMFSIFTYPLELLDSWIVCKNILLDFTSRATTVWIVCSMLSIFAGVAVVILAQDITIILAALLFALAGFLMLGVK